MTQIRSQNPDGPDVWETELHLCHAPQSPFPCSKVISSSVVMNKSIAAAVSTMY